MGLWKKKWKKGFKTVFGASHVFIVVNKAQFLTVFEALLQEHPKSTIFYNVVFLINWGNVKKSWTIDIVDQLCSFFFVNLGS